MENINFVKEKLKVLTNGRYVSKFVSTKF